MDAKCVANGGVKHKAESGSGRFPLTAWEVATASGVVLSFLIGLVGLYLTMPVSDYTFLKLPRSLEDLQILRFDYLSKFSVYPWKKLYQMVQQDNLESYTSDYTIQVLVGYCLVYVFMQTFMIPGTVFMSLLAGALFGLFKGVALVVFTATGQVVKRREGLLNYMLFLRVTPTLPNTFINVASPIVDVPYHIFFLATFIGIIPAAFVTVRAGIALGDLQSMGDLAIIHGSDVIYKPLAPSLIPFAFGSITDTVCISTDPMLKAHQASSSGSGL
ncbi:hypothetical protein SASPL_143084 [Salvia splendens]|uniref:VTT domain-containing protein n=1 Tax=Salvia splendens TaxID=180675 RepID=A0A8X8WLC4_SALSN|nr:hypothetical protein SASPL_143084 [Salvia splendens]